MSHDRSTVILQVILQEILHGEIELSDTARDTASETARDTASDTARDTAWPAGMQSAPQLRAWLWNEVAWVGPLLRTMLAQMCFQNLWLTLTQTIPQTCRSKALLTDTIL